MAESRNTGNSGASPLFDKMDALMRKHRGGTESANDIPVLTEEALEFELEVDHIPVLTDEFSAEGLMFDPREFFAPPQQPAPSPVAATPPRSEPPAVQFLDLPLLDLDVDEPQAGLAAPYPEQPALPDIEVEEIELPAFDLAHEEDWAGQVIPTLEEVIVPLAEGAPSSAALPPEPDAQPFPEMVPQVPPIGFAPEPVTVMDLDEDRFAAPDLEISLPATPAGEPASPPAFARQAEEAVVEDALTLTELPEEPEPHVLTLDAEAPEAVAPVVHASQAPKLDAAAVAEITASVAAQISVEVSTEVAQLTRQHFAGMMNSFYGESLRKITEEISRDMEMCLAPRIAELVQEELRRQGVVD